MSRPDLVFRPMQAAREDLLRLQRLFEKNGTQRSLDAFEWMYLDNPVGRLYVDVAVSRRDEEFVAAYCSLPFHARLGGRKVVALQSLDTLTDEAYRGRGLFPRMARSVFDRAASEGVAFIHGFPNENSAPGFFGKLGWTRLGDAPFLIRPLRTGYFLDRIARAVGASRLPDVALPLWGDDLPPGMAITVARDFDSEVADLIRSQVTDVGVDRDAPYLAWRFTRKPGETYVVHVASGASGPVGVCISTTKSKHGGRVTYVMEIACRPGFQRVASALLHQALVVGLAAGADAALAWCLPGAAHRSLFLRAGFLPFPSVLRPIQLHWGAKPFGPEAARVGNARHWYLSYADSDTV